MTAKEIREKFLKFFESKGHKIIPSAPLIPENDPTVLFTTAGMHPLVPFLLGEKHPLGKRLCNSQKCVRTGDIDEVGDATHLTFFEMLGNWSLGDYFKKEAIEWSFEFLTKELKIPLEKLGISVFSGESENNIPKDEEAARIWQSLGVPKNRIAFLGREHNWWGPAGNTGPCGPDTEMFYWTEKLPIPKDFDHRAWMEIWNDVFMQYNKTAEGKFEELSQKNVDTGMGLERVVAILQGKDSVYETELFSPILEKIAEISGKPYGGNEIFFRVIADHIKAATFILAERVLPSNVERGYVLRRLIRRAIGHGQMLGIKRNLLVEVAKIVIDVYKDTFSELLSSQDFIFAELGKEEEKFGQAIGKGLQKLEKLVKLKDKKNKEHPFLYYERTDFGSRNEDWQNLISGQDAFYIYQTYGLPPKLMMEKLAQYGMGYHKGEFKKEMEKHQELSRTASAGQFKSGLADNSEQTTKYHTATHLMLAALREVLGSDVQQKGSNITPERIRFDFNLDRKMTAEEIKKVEDIVNEKIKQNLAVVCEDMETDKALESGAVGVFGHKYGEKVKVYTIGQNENVCSKEICAGPHVQKTGELGEFKIVKEESVSQGVRRIKAVLQ